jgi:hypothetical protein
MISSIKLTPFEILDKASQYKVRQKAAEYLKKHESYELKTILQGALDYRITFDLPEGIPAFLRDNSPPGVSHTAPKKTYDKLKYLVKGNPLPRIKKEKIFLEILETINAKDTELVIAMKDKKFAELYPTIDAEVVNMAWPNLIAIKK